MTVKLTVVVWLRLPLVPLIVSVKVFLGVDPAVLTLSVELPEPAREVGLNVAVVFAGRPLALKVTVPLNPPDGVMVTV